MNTHDSYPKSFRTVVWVAAAVGIGAAAAGWLLSPEAFYRAYLHGWLLWLGVSLGSLSLLMVGYLVDGDWSSAIRPPAEAAAMVLPLLAVLFVPIAIAAQAGALFPWADARQWRDDPVMAHRSGYLNPPFFIARAVVYFVCWIGLAWAVGRTRSSIEARRAVSGPGLVLLALTIGLFASTDWIVSLEPHYKSTVFGFVILVGQAVTALCVLIPAVYLFGRNALSRNTRNDLGTILLTVTMLWCYLIICQFVINWMGNTQGENRWYIHRLSFGWEPLTYTVMGVHLVMPLMLLLFRRFKRNPAALAWLCGVLLLVRAVDGFVMINASSGDAPSPLLSRFSWLDVAMPIAIGVVWLAGFGRMLGSRAIVPGRTETEAGHAVTLA